MVFRFVVASFGAPLAQRKIGEKEAATAAEKGKKQAKSRKRKNDESGETTVPRKNFRASLKAGLWRWSLTLAFDAGV